MKGSLRICRLVWSFFLGCCTSGGSYWWALVWFIFVYGHSVFRAACFYLIFLSCFLISALICKCLSTLSHYFILTCILMYSCPTRRAWCSSCWCHINDIVCLLYMNFVSKTSFWRNKIILRWLNNCILRLKLSQTQIIGKALLRMPSPIRTIHFNFIIATSIRELSRTFITHDELIIF